MIQQQISFFHNGPNSCFIRLPQLMYDGRLRALGMHGKGLTARIILNARQQYRLSSIFSFYPRKLEIGK